MSNRILTTDGANKNTLSIIRNLGKSYSVDVLTFLSPIITRSIYSKYLNRYFHIRHPEDEVEYQRALIKILKKHHYDVFLPVGLKSYVMASKYKSEISEHTNLIVPNWEKMKIAYNKDLTMKFAKRTGIPIPKTMIITDDSLSEIREFPVVIKASDESGAYVKYCNNPIELRTNYEQLRRKSKTRIIAQEYIRGFGTGFYGVCKHGKLYAVFMHKRIKEFPITGGSSAVAMSYYDKKLFRYGKMICKKLRWDGPLMAEFKYSPEKNEYYLIELNPKLWGSLDLTIKAGVNIPEILIKLALGEKVKPVKTYKKIKFKWMFPDEFKVLLSGGETLREFITRDIQTYTNIDFSDPLPTFFQIAQGILEGIQLSFNKKKRFPHGVLNNESMFPHS